MKYALSALLLVGLLSAGSMNAGAPAGASVATKTAAQSANDSDIFSPADRALTATLSPLPDLPVDATNKYRDSAAAALLGQKLFFEPRLSGPIQTGTPQEGQLGAIGEAGKIACRNCHMPESVWLYDTRSNPNATALGSQWMTRNASSVVN